MKKSYFYGILVIIMTAMMGVSFVSCGDDDDEGKGAVVPPASSIVGKWMDLDEDGYDIYTFNADGKGTVHEYDTEHGQPVLSDVTNFTYTYDASTKILTVNSRGHVEKFRVKTLTATTLVLVDIDYDDVIELVRQ